MTQPSDFGHCFDFNDVFRNEIDAVNKRRGRRLTAKQRRLQPDIALPADDTAQSGSTQSPKRQTNSSGNVFPKAKSNLVGLALSGGGVRSAAFCLGALQALDETGALDRVDYLSTVSGGGYIGCSLTAALEQTGRSAAEAEAASSASDRTAAKAKASKKSPVRIFPFAIDAIEGETRATQHIRDHSNYLFPNGAANILENLSIFVRGLVANAVLVLPFLLFAAAGTILFNPTPERLSQPDILGFPINSPFGHFALTIYLALVLFGLVVWWGLKRSSSAEPNSPDIVEPAKINWTERIEDRQWRALLGDIRHYLKGWPRLIGAAAIIVIGVAFLELQTFVLAAMFHQNNVPFISALLAKISGVVAMLAPIGAAIAFLAQQLAEFIKSGKESNRTRALIAGWGAKAAVYFAALIVPLLLWVCYLKLSQWGINLYRCGTRPGFLPYTTYQLFLIFAYFAAGACLLGIAVNLRPNANSLHPLYRDRLGKAFIIQSGTSPPKLSDMSGEFGPYPLINSALNIQGSEANKRGRNADFFLLSPRFVGSEITKYVRTKDYDQIEMSLDLATAMAISGAAASSNMGAQTIKPLTPTLALLNIRLGYWLRNPQMIKKLTPGQRAPWNKFANFYFFAELIGQLKETRKSVYLTDGGHIENLGIYELLKRKCRVIIAVDAEADREMAFGSFNTLVRYARIDLGIEIDLPWQQITNVTKSTNDAIEKDGNAPKQNGPHVAVGRITYLGRGGSADQTGILIYIKSSLTGDENDYVFHYKKRYWAFPHETTADQVFSEEQFEAYRALGYHATNGFFCRRDDFAKIDPNEFPGAAKAVSEDVALLDDLFPRAPACGTGDKQKFAEWLPPSVAAPLASAAPIDGE